MNIFLTTWLTFATSVSPGLPLQCFTCSEPTDVSSCFSVTNCTMEATACKTVVLSVDSGYPFFGNITVSKSCSKECVPSEPDGIGDNRPEFCCYTDLCNVGAGQEATAMFCAASFTATLALALLWPQI